MSPRPPATPPPAGAVSTAAGSDPVLEVVGVGADGPAGLPAASLQIIESAEVLIGGRRHLAAVPEGLAPTAQRAAWPSPLVPGLDALLAEHRGRRIVVLASGDPLVSGIGTTLIDRLGAGRVRIRPAVSSPALARAAMGWAAEDCHTVTLVGREEDRLRRYLAPGRHLIVLVSGTESIPAVAQILAADGFADSPITVLSHLGDAAREARLDTTAATITQDPSTVADVPALSLLALTCAGGAGRALTPGLPDETYADDGQLTRAPVRALALAALAPRPGELLWDVGAGAGSIGIEWARAHPSCRAVAIERDPDRARRIGRNAVALGVVDAVTVLVGRAPDALNQLRIGESPEARPDAVFVGGGGSRPGVLEACWAALRPGGRLVVHAVTLETEAALIARHGELGGTLTRIAVETAEPLGTFTGWRPARPVVQWAITKPAAGPAQPPPGAAKTPAETATHIPTAHEGDRP